MENNIAPTLNHLYALKNFSVDEITSFEKYIDFITFEVGSFVVHEGDRGNDMYFILSGSGKLQKENLELGFLTEGAHFGELALIANRPRAASIVASSQMRVGKLTKENYNKILKEEPIIGLRLLQSLVSNLGNELIEMTENVELLLKQRSLPRKTHIEVIINQEIHQIKTGTILQNIFPEKINDNYVVAALVNNKATALSTPISYQSNIKPLTIEHWEGERIYRRSVFLLFMEALFYIKPELKVTIGVSIGGAQIISFVNPEADLDCHSLVTKIKERMLELIAKNCPFRHELWFVEEAISYFQEYYYPEAEKLLKNLRQPTVQMISCGRVYIASPEPLVSHSSILSDFELNVSKAGLVLNVGKKPLDAESKEDFRISYMNLLKNFQISLTSLGINSVGDFNQICVEGKVGSIIQVAEAFHEKHLSRLADKIFAKKEHAKIICISGPSSSGKTTFIKRLMIQLRVNGLNPVSISLDDYYLDRENTPKNEKGEYDFERLDALKLDLLREHLSRLINGETVKTAIYDFKLGKSIPEGGDTLKLGEKDVLLIEGIHGLNPHLFNSDVPKDKLFRIFIQPMTSLPFDHIYRFNPSDLRLLRRIVRDRYNRGYSAAQNIMLWPAVREGEQKHIFPFIELADEIFDTSLIYEISVLKVYAERYLLEVPQEHPAFTTAYRLRQLIDLFVAIYPEHVPPNSILGEFIN